MDWIASAGGPLICIERPLESSWGGIDRLTVDCPGATTDYDRACQSADYTRCLPLAAGTALILGAGRLDTSVSVTRSGALVIVQVVCSDVGVNESAILGHIDDGLLKNPIRSIDLTLTSTKLVIFDAAERGNDQTKTSIVAVAQVGDYRLLTQDYNPDVTIRVLLHKFERR